MLLNDRKLSYHAKIASILIYLDWIFSRPVIMFNFLKVTRNFKVYIRRNLRFWKFQFEPPNLEFFFHSAEFYQIFVNMHHLATSMSKISFPIPILV